MVLKDFLAEELYDHFLHLFCAVSLVYCNAYKKHWWISKDLFHEYVQDYIQYYGKDAIGSNIHNLIHIFDDVNRFGNLNEISTYEFENALGKMKRCVRRCDRPIEQVAKRISESFFAEKIKWNDEITFKPFVKHLIPNGSNIEYYQEIKFKPNVVLSTRKHGDKFFFTHSNEIVEMLHVVRSDNSFSIIGNSLKQKEIFFTHPFSSSNLNIFVSNREKNDPKSYKITDIKCKLICLSYKTNSVFIPLLHSLD